jgi:hypothetical protein
MNTPDRNSKPANSRTVLVLDDDVLVRMPVVQFLRDCGAPLHAVQFLPHPQDASAAGVTDRLWSIGDMVKVLEDWENTT